MKNITGKELAALLHHIHTHASNGCIVYPEKPLLKVLKAIGLPEPEWKESYSIAEWKKNKK